MVPQKGSSEKTFGGSWVKLKVDGGTHGALEVILKWFVFHGRETGLLSNGSNEEILPSD